MQVAHAVLCEVKVKSSIHIINIYIYVNTKKMICPGRSGSGLVMHAELRPLISSRLPKSSGAEPAVEGRLRTQVSRWRDYRSSKMEATGHESGRASVSISADAGAFSLSPIRSGHRGEGTGGSCTRVDLIGHADFTVAPIDRAGADVFPAVAVVGCIAGGTDDHGAGENRLAADLADRRAGILRPGVRLVDDRNPLVHAQ